MTTPPAQKPSLASLKALPRRRTVAASQEDLVRISPLLEGPIPYLVTPALEGVDLAAWTATNRSWMERRLRDHGALLFRGFGLGSSEQLERLIQAFSGDLLAYTYRSTPRSQVSGEIYTSTEYPADQSIPMHNEMSYTRSWPLKIWFLCLQPAERGGETPIADSREVYRRIPAALRDRFARRGVMYIRNYGPGLDLSWQSVFQTDDPARVEEYCRSAGIFFEWRDDGHLRTRQVCQAVATHPVTGEPVWFNQAHLFHVSGLEPAVRKALLAQYGEEDLPRNALYGDGSPIEPEAFDEIRRVYAEVAVRFPWQAGDVLMLDNMLVAHGRTPFSGPRKVLVGMAESHAPELVLPAGDGA